MAVNAIKNLLSNKEYKEVFKYFNEHFAEVRFDIETLKNLENLMKHVNGLLQSGYNDPTIYYFAGLLNGQYNVVLTSLNSRGKNGKVSDHAATPVTNAIFQLMEISKSLSKVSLEDRRLLTSTKLYGMYKSLYRIALRGMGILNWEDPLISGEENFMRDFMQKRKNPVVIDVGAHTGKYSMMAKRFCPGAVVHAIEPHPVSFRKLQETAKENAFSAYNLGLSDVPGTFKMYDYKGGNGSSHASLYESVISEIHHGEAEAVDVQLTTLDDFIESNHIDRVDLLKIDTEGHEMPVLKGAGRSLEKGIVQVIHLEFNEMNVMSKTFMKEIYDFLDNYEFFRMMPDGLVQLGNYKPIEWEIFAFQNIVAMKKSQLGIADKEQATATASILQIKNQPVVCEMYRRPSRNPYDKEVADFKEVAPMVNKVEGFLARGQENALFNIVKQLPKNAVIVEIGSFKGRSTVSMGYAARGTDRIIHTIDTFKGNESDPVSQSTLNRFGDYFQVFLKNIRDCGVEAYVEVYRAFSFEVVKQWNTPIDFIFIDGSHKYEDVKQDIAQWFPFIKPNGIIGLHDVVHTWPGPLQAWNEFKPRLIHVENFSSLAWGRKPAG